MLPIQRSLICLIFMAICRSTLAVIKEMTVSIEAGKSDCFYEMGKIGQVIDIEYQVVDGGHGDLDINFELVEPTARIIFADFKKSDNVHRHEVRVEGDYRFCFDNTFSTFNRKTVFFELYIENEDEQSQQEDEFGADLLEGLTPEEFYDLKVQDIQDAIGRVKAHITKARHLQDMLKSFEARDRNIAEENFYKVNAWSAFQILIMVGVGMLQVVVVRSLFDTDSKMHSIWKKLCL